ncbi:MFS transporter [Rhodococcus sp. 114MFTsu3.1]|uniref:MFS transporter n=1 Tax=Rhodococcus sp. 114MFTsu3.1 TaxID=1172184 RepID=UPI000363C298|nr:MFS transporter [Rhodococcus sp. 114MFTsu3.1]
MTQKPTPTSDAAEGQSARRRLFGGAVGTFVEWFDFVTYAVTAPTLALLFFPESNPSAAVLGTLAIFAVGFVARPLGGVVFGYLGDKYGRIRIMAAVILLMGVATGAIGLLPTYASIGIAAPILLLVFRLIQGFSTGGEHSGALSFVIESAPSNKRASWIAIIYAVTILPSLVLGFGIIALRGVIGDEAYTTWGWRMPFILGALLACLGLWIRLKLSDPREFVEANKERVAASKNPLKMAVVEEWPALLRVFLLLAPTLIAYYLGITYLYTHMVSNLGMVPNTALLANTLAGASIAILVPLLGRLADRVGRKPLMWTGAVYMTVIAFPAMFLVNTATFWGAFAGSMLLAIATSLFVSGSIVTMLELFRTSSRYSGHGLSYGMGTVVFGGFTPIIAGSLIDAVNPSAPAAMVVAAGIVGMIVLRFTPETRDVALATAAAQGEPASGPEGSTRSSMDDTARSALS